MSETLKTPAEFTKEMNAILTSLKKILKLKTDLSKLKPDEKEQSCSFFHGEHDKVYIGSSFDIFEPFTEEEVKMAVTFGLSVSDDGDGFEMYASM